MKMNKQFQAAEQSGAKYGIIVGAEYPSVTIKNLAERIEETVDASELVETISKFLNS